MKGPQELQLLLAVVFVLVAAIRGATVTYNWTLDYSIQSPDCVEKLIIAINDEFPGPGIRVTVGDTVVVNMINLMPTETVVIHWHGMLQTGTPWADGAAYISQCPILPLETYRYSFVAEQVGTYFYHGHNGMQRAAGLYGTMIVDPKPETPVPFTYDGELNITLNDWWHTSMYNQEIGLFSNPFQWVGEPQSLLIEGRGAYNCSSVPAGSVVGSGDSVTCNATNPMKPCTPHVLQVEPNKTYRLRIISVASLEGFNFVIEGHSLTVVELSGKYVEPFVVQNLDVYSGDTYSVLFNTSQDPSHNYWAAINVIGRKPATPTGLAVLNYVPNLPTDLPTTPAPVGPVWNDTNLRLANAQAYKALAGYIDPLPDRKTDRVIKLLNTQNKLNGFTKWSLNNITYQPISTPILAALKYKIENILVPTPPDFYTAGYNISAPPPNPNTTAGSGVYIFELNDVVDVILQNANVLAAGTSETHPWHLHGHDFWVLGYGMGEFNDAMDYAKLNYANPPKMNTAPLFPYGWTFLRFVANNPGAWPFHCHIEPHFHMGMGVVFAEGVDQLPAIPKEDLGCGLTKNFIQVP